MSRPKSRSRTASARQPAGQKKKAPAKKARAPAGKKAATAKPDKAATSRTPAASRPAARQDSPKHASSKRASSTRVPSKPAPSRQGSSRQAGLARLQELLELARRAGADAADAVLIAGTQLSVGQRLGKREKLERSEGRDLGLRVLIGKRQAMVSTTDFSAGALKELAARAVAMARAVPEDPYCGIAAPELLATSWPDLDLDDGREPSPETLLDWTARAEDAARAVRGVTNSEGAEAGWSRTEVTLAASNGFSGSYRRGGYSVSVAVLAGTGTGMERDYDWTSGTYVEDMEAPERIGRRAGKRAVARLNPTGARSARVPVVYDPRVAGSMLGHFTAAINGRAIARGTSFLKDCMGKQVFAPEIDIVEDPHRKRGNRSKPFDGEGLPTRRRKLIDGGMLTSWLLDLASAWQLGLEPTGHAARGTGGPPSPSASNISIARGKLSPKALMADIKSGFYVTELIGFGINGVTGDYSRGASGFWIENGEIARPVAGVTVAGNLKDMFRNMRAANDLKFRTGSDSPTLRIDGMTVAGQ